MSEELGLSVKKKEDFGKWYLEVVQKAGVLDTRYGLKGFLVYMPTGMLMIKEVVRLFDVELQKTGHNPVLFPVVIPEKFMKKEGDHIKGFQKEVFWITHAGENKLDERMCLRPTSETAMYPLFSIWIRSHQQLPLKIYQDCCVYRYETKMTKPLMRGREFYWIEAHTAHKTFDDAENQTKEDMQTFENVVTKKLGIPFLLIKRPDWDKFPGAENTYAFEAILPDGNSLQIGTTHNLGEKFSKVFNIKYLDSDKKKKYVNQTSYGPGIARILSAVISIHGDDKGLIFPPVVAPIQIVIVPVYTKTTKTKVLEKAGELYGRLEEKGFRVYLDDREKYTPGFKFHEWELKGVPLRIEIGPLDIKNNKVSISRRDSLERMIIDENKMEEHVLEILDSIGFQLDKRAKEMMKIIDASNMEEIKEALKDGGFIRIPFCMKQECAENFKEKTKAEIRGTLFGKKEKAKDKCAICTADAKELVYVARSY